MIGKIAALSWNYGSGIATVKFDDGSRVLVESGYGLRMFALVFGTLDGAIGQVIEYEVDDLGVMSSFSLPEESE